MICRIHLGNFEQEVLRETKPVLIVCLPKDDLFLQQIEIIQEFSESHFREIKVGLIEEDFFEVFKKNFSVSGTPTFLLLEKGREKGRILGLADQGKLRALTEGPKTSPNSSGKI